MNIFTTMSDMVADAEDLLRALGDSKDPECQALRPKIESSIDDMKRHLRQQIKARAQSEDESTPKLLNAATVNPWLIAGVAALAAAFTIGAITHRHT
jgi:ElaB/YqjD/DUF883 family membrane-anchored ribosome-binding protein